MNRSMKAFVFVPAICIMAACTQKASPPTDNSTSGNTQTNEPVTIRMYQKIAGISDTELQRYFVEPVRKKFPNVTMQLVRAADPGNSEQDLLASNQFPDMIYTSNPSIPLFKELMVVEELTPHVKTFGLPLDAYNQTAVDTVRLFGKDNELHALPFSANYGIMVYNKDIFDQFGVMYPKDGMTWEEAFALSKKMTASSDGVSYIGLDPYNVPVLGSAMALPLVDPVTNKAVLQNDGWGNVLRFYKQLFELPGYVNEGKYQHGINAFTKDKTLAMYTPWLDMVVNQVRETPKLNWDLAQLPNFQGSVGKGREYDVHLVMLSNKSKNKEIAFQIMQLVTASEDVQLDLMKQGRVSVLNKPDWEKQFASNHEAFNGKNVAAVFKSKPVLPHFPSKYDSKASAALVQRATKELAATSKDVNTILRETEEFANQEIQKVLQK